MQIHEGWGFDGAMIATSLSTAKKTIEYPEPLVKLFYIWDLEWLRTKIPNYQIMASIYRSNDFTLVARCKDYKDAVEDLWNVSVPYIVEECNIEKFIDIIEEIYNGVQV